MTLHRSRTLFFLVGRDFLQNAKRLRSWKSSLNLAKQRPASHITAFAILHELTAIIPFAVIYFPVKWCQISSHIPLSKDLIQGFSVRQRRRCFLLWAQSFSRLFVRSGVRRRQQTNQPSANLLLVAGTRRKLDGADRSLDHLRLSQTCSSCPSGPQRVVDTGLGFVDSSFEFDSSVGSRETVRSAVNSDIFTSRTKSRRTKTKRRTYEH